MMHTTKSRWTKWWWVAFAVVPASLVWAQAPSARPKRAKATEAKPAATAAQPAKPAGTAPAGPVDPTAVLKAVPADAAAFLAIRHLDELDKDIVGLARTLGILLGPGGVFPDPLDWLVKEQLAIQEGLDVGGSAALVLADCRDVETAAEVVTKLVLLIPCTDPDAVMTQLGAQKAEDLATVTLMGQLFFAAPKGRYLVAGQTPAMVKAVLEAKGGGIEKVMAPDRVKAFAQQDLFGWIRFSHISQQVRAEIRSSLAGLMAMLNPKAMTDTETSFEELGKIVDDSQEFALGLALDRRGIDLSVYMRVKPDTDSGRQMAAVKGTSESLLTGLPNEPVIAAFGSAGHGAGQETQLRRMFDLLLDEDKLGDAVPADKLEALKTGLVKSLTSVERLSLSLVNLPAEAGQGLIGLTVVVGTTDGKQWRADAKKLFDIGKEIIVALATKKQPDEQKNIQQAADAVAWKTDAEQVNGSPVDHLVVDLSKLPDVDEETLNQIKAVVGPDGLLLRLGPVGDRHIVLTFGGGSKRFTQVAELVAKGESPLAGNDGIQKAGKWLPAEPKVMEAYVNLDQIITLITGIAMKVGQPLALPITMRHTGPIALAAVKGDPTAQEFHLLVPTELLVSAKEAVLPLMPLLMGGGSPDSGMDMDMDDSAPSDSGIK